MSRQSSIRNQRAKGLKLEHGVQVLVLIMVCIWLVHRAKHLHAKSKAMIGEDAMSTTSNFSGLETLRLGRKDLIGNDVRTLQDEDEAGEEEPEIFKEADEEDGRVISDQIDVNDVIEVDDIDDIVKVHEDPKKELGENDTSGGKDQESEYFENSDHESAQINSQEAREDQYKQDNPSDTVIQNPKDIDAKAEWAVDRNLDEEKMGELGTKNTIEAIERDINFNITQDIDEYLEHQESEIHLSDDRSVDPSVLREDRKLEAGSLASLAVGELIAHGEGESNLTTKAPSGSNPGHTVDEEAGKGGASTEEKKLEEKLLTSPLTRNESRVFDERGYSLAKDGVLGDEESLMDLITLPKDQPEMKMVGNRTVD